mmetsp:Transcript_28869/g.33031  ORF Transcript_28869/g.33031 Transcript_28869/m.33031 type:complete len:96 (-) Transcript_28869:56-343(-)
MFFSKIHLLSILILRAKILQAAIKSNPGMYSSEFFQKRFTSSKKRVEKNPLLWRGNAPERKSGFCYIHLFHQQAFEVFSARLSGALSFPQIAISI